MSIGHPSSRRDQNTAAAARILSLPKGKKRGVGFGSRVGFAHGILYIYAICDEVEEGEIDENIA